MQIYIGKVGFKGPYYSEIAKKDVYWVEGPDGDATQVPADEVHAALVELFNKWM